MLKYLVFFFLLACQQVKTTSRLAPPLGFDDTVYGKVEMCSKHHLCIIKNWQSRSRVSYFVEGAWQEKLRSYLGQVVEVQGRVSKEISPWQKMLVVDRLLRAN